MKLPEKLKSTSPNVIERRLRTLIKNLVAAKIRITKAQRILDKAVADRDSAQKSIEELHTFCAKIVLVSEKEPV